MTSRIEDDNVPVFRVVEHNGVRRGIRLERIYWDVLREIAQADGKRIGVFVQSVIGDAPPSANATSHLRVFCLRWAIDMLASAKEMSGSSNIANLVRASPSPTFALGLDKRIVAFNQAFLGFVQSRFSHVPSEPASRDLRLALDGQLTELATRLKSNGNAPVDTGFVVEISGRRVRGKLNVLLAPSLGPSVLLCYILP